MITEKAAMKKLCYGWDSRTDLLYQPVYLDTCNEIIKISYKVQLNCVEN